MNKNAIATLFIVLFMAIIAAPSILVALDDTIDTSIFFSINEEEEENGEIKNIKVFFSLQPNNYCLFQDLKKLQYLGNRCKYYPKPYLNLISPPPKFQTL